MSEQQVQAKPLENEIIVAILAHANAQTPKQRREAWDRLLALKAQKQRQEPNT